MTFKSIYSDQQDILDAIVDLHAKDGFECDLTYGNGSFWRGRPPPKYKYDIDPQVDCVTASSSTEIPHPDSSLGNVIFDPPFLTYVRAGRNGNGSMLMSQRFGGYWRYDELADHYTKTLDECRRVMKPKSVLVFKCQDVIHNHKMHPTHVNVVNWAEAVGFRIKDIFILHASHRMPSPNRLGKQKHARVFHSYFLVFERLTQRQEKAMRRWNARAAKAK